MNPASLRGANGHRGTPWHVRVCLTVLVAGETWVPGVRSADVVFDRSTVIVASDRIPNPMRDAGVQVLQDAVEARTAARWAAVTNWPVAGVPVVALALSGEATLLGHAVPKSPSAGAPEHRGEGYRVVREDGAASSVLWVLGADARGVLYGLGRVLRALSLTPEGLQVPGGFDAASAPAYAIRGHQLGYRNAANSWDAWDVAQFERYIRELALFGANCIENIPFQGGPPGPHMRVPRDEMNRAMSALCARYDLDFWVWTPADVDLSDPAQRAAEVERHAAMYADCPRLDGVFFPGGDPGDNHPRDVLPFLEAIAAVLQRHHPRAGVWISLQGFSEERVDWFYRFLERVQPAWLRGVVTGPGSPDLAETRHRLPARYQHRHYPDLTHNVRCQYPVARWDQAYALTLGREACNPRPFAQARIHNRFAPFTDGFLSYSDGVHDDVNKAVWSALAWDPGRDVREILVEYGRCYLGAAVAEAAADGILALEQNWSGPIEENGGVEAAFAYWQGLEAAEPALQGNWRWQQLVLRAYYDTYTRRRKAYEQGLEREANAVLARADVVGPEAAMREALALVQRADRVPIAIDLRRRIEHYCEALFRSIGLQTSVARYQASGAERGCVLDFVDYPLNNRWWLEDEFAKVRQLPTPAEQRARLELLRTWEDPGPGSYYDNVSDVSKGPRVRSRSDDGTDVAWWDNGRSRRRLSTQLFQNQPRLEYVDLDPAARYGLRVAGQGEALVRANGVRLEPSAYPRGLEEFKEFPVPRRLVTGGRLEVTFDQPEESHLNWRQHSKVCEVWLLRVAEGEPRPGAGGDGGDR